MQQAEIQALQDNIYIKKPAILVSTQGMLKVGAY